MIFIFWLNGRFRAVNRKVIISFFLQKEEETQRATKIPFVKAFLENLISSFAQKNRQKLQHNRNSFTIVSEIFVISTGKKFATSKCERSKFLINEKKSCNHVENMICDNFYWQRFFHLFNSAIFSFFVLIFMRWLCKREKKLIV